MVRVSGEESHIKYFFYIDYNESLFNFHKVDEEEKIIEIDLDNCEIKDRKGGKDDGVENEKVENVKEEEKK